MNKYRNSIPLFLAFIMVIGLSTSPTFAEHGGSSTVASGGSTTTQTTTSDSHQTSNGDKNTATSPTIQSTEDKNMTSMPEVNTELEHETEIKDKANGQSDLVDMQKNGQKNSDSVKKQNCENDKHGITTKATALGTNAERYQAKIDKIFQQTEDFQKTNNITVTNFDTLILNAKKAQTQAVASIAALKAVNVTIDCTQPSVAGDVATIKAAASQARTDLRAYKQAVIDLLTALENTKVEGSN
jgi:hypothetical protein